jgi:hypothetical protein
VCSRIISDAERFADAIAFLNKHTVDHRTITRWR